MEMVVVWPSRPVHLGGVGLGQQRDIEHGLPTYVRAGSGTRHAVEFVVGCAFATWVVSSFASRQNRRRGERSFALDGVCLCRCLQRAVVVLVHDCSVCGVVDKNQKRTRWVALPRTVVHRTMAAPCVLCGVVGLDSASGGRQPLPAVVLVVVRPRDVVLASGVGCGGRGGGALSGLFAMGDAFT